MLPELGNKNIHASGIEKIIIAPYFIQHQAAFKHLVPVDAKQPQNFRFTVG